MKLFVPPDLVGCQRQLSERSPFDININTTKLMLALSLDDETEFLFLLAHFNVSFGWPVHEAKITTNSPEMAHNGTQTCDRQSFLESHTRELEGTG